MKKTTTIFVFLLCAFSLSAMQQSTLEHSKPSMEERMQKVEDQLKIDTQYFDYLSSYAANCYLSVDALIWAAENYGWPAVTNPEGDFEEGDYRQRGMSFDPGFRLGFAVKTCYDWDVFLQYTYLHSSNKFHYIDDGAGMLSAFFPFAYLNFQSKFKLNYDMLDFEIGRPFNIAKTFVLKTHIGFRTGWIKQKGMNKAENALAPAGFWTSPGIVTYKNKTWVMGPRIGFNADYYFGTTGLSFYGNLAGALLYAKPEGTIQTYYFNIADGILELRNTSRTTNKELKSTIQAAFGLAWGDFITDDKDLALTLRLGWEGNYWWNMYDFSHNWSLGDPSGDPITFNYIVNSPLIMQGMTISARLDF